MLMQNAGHVLTIFFEQQGNFVLKEEEEEKDARCRLEMHSN